MLKKAYRYDDNILFYFDHQDSKYVAEGGSIAWRSNNPGLLSSRNSHVYKPIGNHLKLASDDPSHPPVLYSKNVRINEPVCV